MSKEFDTKSSVDIVSDVAANLAVVTTPAERVVAISPEDKTKVPVTSPVRATSWSGVAVVFIVNWFEAAPQDHPHSLSGDGLRFQEAHAARLS